LLHRTHDALGRGEIGGQLAQARSVTSTAILLAVSPPSEPETPSATAASPRVLLSINTPQKSSL